jgi:hypothetical protein
MHMPITEQHILVLRSINGAELSAQHSDQVTADSTKEQKNTPAAATSTAGAPP